MATDVVKVLSDLGQPDEWLVDALAAWGHAPELVRAGLHMRDTPEAKVAYVNAVVKRFRPEPAVASRPPGPSFRYLSKFRVVVLERDNQWSAATVVVGNFVATYAHAPHDTWEEGTEVQVLVEVPGGEQGTRAPASAMVVAKFTPLDVALLKVTGTQLEAPVLDNAIRVGEEYALLACSATSQIRQPDSVTHGWIVCTSPDEHGHIKGDMRSVDGDSGGGCFAVETGKLLGICVGWDRSHHGVGHGHCVIAPTPVLVGCLGQKDLIPANQPATAASTYV